MELVTITFKEDLELCRYQLVSIRKFLKPCKLTIIVNESNLRYVNHAKRFLYKEVYKLRQESFKVSIISGPELLLSEGIDLSEEGWFTQQLLKLIFPTNNDYIVLDCKDIFIKPIFITELIKEHVDLQPNLALSKNWRVFYEKTNTILTQHYQKTVDQRLVRNIQTPRLIKHEIRQEIPKIWGNKTKFGNWFLDCSMPSEFVLYDLIRLHKNDPFETCWNENDILGLWETRHFYEEFLNEDIIKHTKILKVHRRLLEHDEVKKAIFKWLDNLLTS